MEQPQRSFSSLFRPVRMVALVLLLATILPVVILRWLPPPVSAVMVNRRFAAWRDGDRQYRLRYRWVNWKQISPNLRIAVVAAEDQKFPQHFGFDFESITDAWKDHEDGARLRGASTISQQVAKNLFLWPGRSFIRKGLEAYFTVLVELLWSKQRILEVYLNVAEFGKGIFGAAGTLREVTGPAQPGGSRNAGGGVAQPPPPACRKTFLVCAGPARLDPGADGAPRREFLPPRPLRGVILPLHSPRPFLYVVCAIGYHHPCTPGTVGGAKRWGTSLGAGGLFIRQPYLTPEHDVEQGKKPGNSTSPGARSPRVRFSACARLKSHD
jgi:monofunctional biosynthetic peptidoglycan transglycosylase